MGSSAMLHSLCCCTTQLLSPKCYNNQTLSFTRSQFVSSNSFLTSKNQTLRIKSQRTRKSNVVFAVQSNIFKALQTAWNVGKDGIEAGTSLVPASVPRPIARISVTIVALSVCLFVLKSFVSTVFFVLATMGLAYFVFIALNKDEGPRGNGGTTSKPEDGADNSLEEARRIMEKYK
ncbi:uncharacterized protein LOC126785462 [Argentina anserina]|uniref:uncharacterized protein LOC126785462 n=1 Tax=Argentina anserina TaxID=57926 RepID=UPI00217685E6|nr:uncharacterized protein LOC126785462 [Potentilla anserina]